MLIRLFHGTAHDFSCFRDDHPGAAEANASLGLHLTECPFQAWEYALKAGRDRGAGIPRVLSVQCEAGLVGVVSSRFDFFGGQMDRYFPEELAAGADEFGELRRELLGRGFDAIAGSNLGDDLAGAWVLLRPSSAVIVGCCTEEDELDGLAATFVDDGIDYRALTLFPRFYGTDGPPLGVAEYHSPPLDILDAIAEVDPWNRMVSEAKAKTF